LTWPTDQVTGQPEKIKKIIEILIAQVEKLINNSYRFDFKCENRWYIYIYIYIYQKVRKHFIIK
jgi:hypothetical protein